MLHKKATGGLHN
jgi:hypothetical protein